MDVTKFNQLLDQQVAYLDRFKQIVADRDEVQEAIYKELQPLAGDAPIIVRGVAYDIDLLGNHRAQITCLGEVEVLPEAT